MTWTGAGELNFFNPPVSFIGAEFPGCKIILDIAEHTSPFSRCIAFFHHQVPAQLENNIKGIDADRAFLYAGITTGACH